MITRRIFLRASEAIWQRNYALSPLSPSSFKQCLTSKTTSTSISTSTSASASASASVLSVSSLLTADKSKELNDINVNGHVRSIRKQKNVYFVALQDGTTSRSVQVVLDPDLAKGITRGTALSFAGDWKFSKGQHQSHELVAKKVKIIGDSDISFPLQKTYKFHNTEFLRAIPHLRSRLPFNILLLQLRSQVISSVTNYFASHDFIQTHPPVITSSDCEGAGEVFTVSPMDFFKSPKYLTVSSQLHLEALAQSVGKVWTLTTAFRAEASDTPRHVGEFYMLEAEVAWVNSLDKIMDITENMLQAVATNLINSKVGEELIYSSYEIESKNANQVLLNRWKRLKDGNWPRISYTDAIRHLESALLDKQTKFQLKPKLGNSLQAEHERYLAESIGNGGPVFITDYPRDVKAFYMLENNSSQPTELISTVQCFDLIVPELLELAGGSMREHRLEVLLESMKRHKLIKKDDVPENLQWYVDLRKWGSVPHGGFGLGFDRLLCYLAGVSSLRDMVTFPRYFGMCQVDCQVKYQDKCKVMCQPLKTNLKDIKCN